jgi:PAS domain S-box-containing protein
MRKSIRGRLIMVIIGLAVAPLLVVGSILAWQSFVSLQQQALVLQREVAERVSTQVMAFFQELENELSFTIKTEGQGKLDQDQNAALSNLLAYQPAFDELHLLDQNGREQVGVYRLSLGATGPEDRSSADEFVIPKTTGQVYYGPIFYDETTNEPLMTIAIPVIDLRTGSVDGVLVSVARVKKVWDLIAGITVSQGQSIYIVDAQGKVVAHRNPSVVLRGTSFKVPDQNGVQLGLTGERAVLAINSLSLGQQRLNVIAEQTINEALSPAINMVLVALALVVVVAGIAGVLSLLSVRPIVNPIQALAKAAEGISAGDLTSHVPVTSNDEIGMLATTFNNMTSQLRAFIATLEQRVSERTQALKTSTEVSRRLSTLLNQDELIAAVVNNVQRAFDYYHVHIYLLDDPQENLVMAGGTGEAGQEMLRSGHAIQVGKGLVGRAAEENAVVLVSDTVNDPNWLPNPLLPDTRSEAAIPIAVGNQLLGILDVQENIVEGLSDQDIDLLLSIANQTAVALQNARQYQQTQDAYREVELSQERLLGVLEIGRMAMWEFDIVNQKFILNDQFYRVIGYDADRLGGYVLSGKEFVTRLVHPEDARRVIDAMRREPEDSDPGFRGRIEYRIFQGDGALQYVLAEYRIERDENGRPSRAFGFHMDITDRKKAELASAKQAQELAIVAQVSTEASTILEPQEFLQSVVDLVKSSFDLYHVHIYLTTEDRRELELMSGAGEIGEMMVAQGWRIPISSERSLVARAARERQGVIVNDVRTEPGFLPNELLPETVSEMAIPMIAGEYVLGVMDVQASIVDRFTMDDVAVYTTLASQVAISLQNARQYQQTKQSEQLTRTIIDATPDWIFIKDREHRFQLVNNAYANSLHLTPEEIIGKHDLDLGFPEEIVMGDPDKNIRGFWPDDDQVIEEGEIKVIPSEPVVLDGEQRWLSTVKVPLKNESGDVWGVLGFVRDITEREQLQRETEERLDEINTLYRAISRESWKSFQERTERANAFYFDKNAVQPAGELWREETQRVLDEKQTIHSPTEQPVFATPLALRGDVIGALAIELDPLNPLKDEEVNLLNELSEQIVLALESARLFEQTQYALSETETLYDIIAEMNAADSYDDILEAVSSRTFLDGSGLVLMGLFDHPMGGPGSGLPSPEWIVPVSHRGSIQVEISPRYPLNAFESQPNTLFCDKPVVLKDLSADKRLDSVTRTLFKEIFMAESAIIVPLRLADQTIGFIQGLFSQTVEIPSAEIERLMAVAGQAAIAVQSRLLLEQAQARALQEQRIREVTERVFEAADVQTIMRRAVEQVGRSLGVPAYIYLSSDSSKAKELASTSLDFKELP